MGKFPGSALSPVRKFLAYFTSKNMGCWGFPALTSFSLLFNNCWLHARIRSRGTLSLERSASIASAPSVQSLLQHSFLPSE